MTEQYRDPRHGGQAASVEAEAEARAQEVAAEAVDVRQRIREAFVDLFRRKRPPLSAMGDMTRAMTDGAMQGLREVAPQERENVLRQVIDGLRDGFISTANATRLALEETRGRGETFAREDVEKVMNDLTDAERSFVEGVTHGIRQAGTQVADGLKDLNEHAVRAFQSARPPVQSAIAAAASHPVMLARDTASVALRAVPKTAGMLFQAMSGVLQGAGDLLSGADRDQSAPGVEQPESPPGSGPSAPHETGPVPGP